MSFLYLENLFEKFMYTLSLRAYKATIVWKDLVLSLFLYAVLRSKDQWKSTSYRNSKNNNFSSQLDPPETLQKCN